MPPILRKAFPIGKQSKVSAHPSGLPWRGVKGMARRSPGRGPHRTQRHRRQGGRPQGREPTRGGGWRPRVRPRPAQRAPGAARRSRRRSSVRSAAARGHAARSAAHRTGEFVRHRLHAPDPGPAAPLVGRARPGPVRLRREDLGEDQGVLHGPAGRAAASIAVRSARWTQREPAPSPQSAPRRRRTATCPGRCGTPGGGWARRAAPPRRRGRVRPAHGPLPGRFRLIPESAGPASLSRTTASRPRRCSALVPMRTTGRCPFG